MTGEGSAPHPVPSRRERRFTTTVLLNIFHREARAFRSPSPSLFANSMEPEPEEKKREVSLSVEIR